MTRQIIKLENLIELMNNELARFDTCVECRFKTIVPLETPDETGCNWSHANLNCRGFPAAVGMSVLGCQPATVCRPVAAQVMVKAKAKYNVW